MGSRAGEPECYGRARSMAENRDALATVGGGRRRGGGGVSLPWAAHRSPRGRGGTARARRVPRRSMVRVRGGAQCRYQKRARGWSEASRRRSRGRRGSGSVVGGEPEARRIPSIFGIAGMAAWGWGEGGGRGERANVRFCERPPPAPPPPAPSPEATVVRREGRSPLPIFAVRPCGHIECRTVVVLTS
jgi:hypothetical protein